MKLITEINEEVKVLTEESEGGSKNFFIEGIFMQAERKNKNGRMYPVGVLQKEANRYITEYVMKNRAYGELGHPDGPSINLERVSHMIKELRQEGNDFYGKAKIMDTPYGNIVKNLISEGACVGVSTRGMGSLVERSDGTKVVKDDFYLATAADIVADPSAPDAFVRGIMEGVEFWYNPHANKWMIEHLDSAKKEVKKMTVKQIEEQKFNLFKNYLNELARK